MVATSRLRRAKEAATKNRPYADKMAEVVSEIAANAGDFSHPLLEEHQEGKSLLLVLAADKGLAGAYSSNAFKEALSHVENKESTDFIVVGRKTQEFFKNRGYHIVQAYEGISEKPRFEHARTIAEDLISRFASGTVKEIHMVSTRFISSLRCEPETKKLLPFTNLGGEKKGPRPQYIYEPSAEEVLGYLLPQYLITEVYAALLQSAASELSSRMNAMSNATDNADELIAKLELHYNKVRQAGITREITEIVGGAEALK